jgi:hypothetical protein
MNATTGNWQSATEGIGNAIRLRNGKYNGCTGTYWAWPVDGYFDLHFVDQSEGPLPDGSDVIHECLPTLAEARKEARELHKLEEWGF